MWDHFDSALRECYNETLFRDHPELREKIHNRFQRFIGKLSVPLAEANSRGVGQSSIWGNVAATIWARESSKKPYWPALCLGMLPPPDQQEKWHLYITERNEARLPEKLQSQLLVAKKKCEQLQKRQRYSYFMVEFLGTHEFIWVRETDIVEDFDADNDPNKSATANVYKKQRNSIVGSKQYATALEECAWANDEYENSLTEAFIDACKSEEELNAIASENGEDVNYSYALLAQSDDEADAVDDKPYEYDKVEMGLTDLDETNWLLNHSGKLDTTAIGRKNTKKRVLSLKSSIEKRRTEDRQAEARKVGGGKKPKIVKGATSVIKIKGSLGKAKEKSVDKRLMKEIEKRRKKRSRDREKYLRTAERDSKKHRLTGAAQGVADAMDESMQEDETRGLGNDKRARAAAIAQAYVTRMTQSGQYKSLATAGVMQITTAMIDSTGLLGIALAFRAAAGEASTPDENDLVPAKPWGEAETQVPDRAVDRVKLLQQKISLVKAEIERTRRNTARRHDLCSLALSDREKSIREIFLDEDAARNSSFKKKKKSPSAAVEDDDNGPIEDPDPEEGDEGTAPIGDEEDVPLLHD
jgi:hypothetical protein